VGKHCEAGDILISDIRLPSNISSGDLLVIPVTGAYGYSMASNYNLLPRPAVVALGSSGSTTSELVIPRQTWQDIVY
jgi:diaminopimelate decarboxylase